jgi:hypothetical protein
MNLTSGKIDIWMANAYYQMPKNHSQCQTNWLITCICFQLNRRLHDLRAYFRTKTGHGKQRFPINIDFEGCLACFVAPQQYNQIDITSDKATHMKINLD